MIRQGNILRCMRRTAAVAALFANFWAQVTTGQGLRYQDTNELPEFGTVNVSPTSAFKSNLPVVDNDNLWNFRDFGANTTVYQSGVTEDSPMLTQTVTGLTPGTSYDLYAVYWTDDDENWTIRTGTSAGSLTNYSWTGGGGSFPVAGSTHGLSASAAVWAAAPPPTKVGTPFIEARPASTEPFMDPLVMLLAKAGTATANGSGQIEVFVDDNASLGGPRRTWLDGIAYANANTPIAITASLDRATGALSLTNPTAQGFQIKAIHIESPTTGALDATAWSRVSSTNPSWAVTMPTTDPATTEFTNILAENGGTNTITLGSNGGTLNFGNVWNSSPFDHIRIFLTLADDSLAVLSPTLAGSAIVSGDLDSSGAINLADFQILLNGLHTMPGLTRVENYRRGELTGDGLINFADWAVFRAAYDLANGAGAFASLVPEPGTCGLLLILTSIVSMSARRRAARITFSVVVSWLVLGLSTSFALDIKVDLDSMRTSGTATAGPLSTQAGFTSWDTTNVGMDGTTTTVDGVTFEIFGLNAANQSRVRTNADGTLNGGGGSFNDVLGDFVFNEGADGRAIGLRITNLPVGMYTMQSWHHDLTIATPEVTQVEVRNQGDPTDPSQIVVSASPWSNSPLQYPLSITTPGQVREVIFREASAGNRARFNGFTISDVPPPLPIELTLQVNTTTGAVSILNEQSIGFDVSYYEIRSVAGALNPAGWTSLDDSEGGDPVGTGWEEATVQNANILSEVNLMSMTTFAPGNSATLGNAFTPGGMQNVSFLYAGPTETALHTGNVKYVTGPSGVNGDYNGNNVVDAADYVLWRDKLGTATTLPNDTTPGNVTQEDFTVWRANFGKTAGAGASLINGAAVPEPATIVSAVLLILAGLQSQRSTRGPRYPKMN